MVQSNSQVGVVAAHMSKTKGGPFDVGDPGDLHTLGYDADGNPIHSLHIQTGAYFRRNKIEDGPLYFEGAYPGAENGPHKMKVHLTWAGGVWKWYAESSIYPVPTDVPTHTLRPVPSIDPLRLVPSSIETSGRPILLDNTPIQGPFPASDLSSDVPTPGGHSSNTEMSSLARLHAAASVLFGALAEAEKLGDSSLIFELLEELSRLTDRITEAELKEEQELQKQGDFEASTPPNVSSFDWSHASRGFNASLSSLACPDLLARPQNIDSSSSDLRNTAGNNLNSAVVDKIDAETPITGAMCAYGAQGGDVPSGYTTDHEGYEGDPWHYTQRPANSKYRGGTASGGWFLFPPEIGPEDRESGYAPPGVTLSNTFLGVAPGARFAAGTPESANGGVSTGFSFGVDSATGNLEFYSHPNTTIEDLAVIFGNSDQNIYWYSGVEFWGMIEHANTANRTYTFPDASGTIPLGTGVANQVVYWSGTSSLVGDTDFTFDGTTLGFSGVFSGIPTAGRHFTWNDSGVDSDFRVESDDEAYCLMVEGTLNNVVLCANAEPAFNNMDGGLFLADANVVPDGNPTGGGYMYSEGGALKWRGSSGTVTTIAVP